MSMISRARAWNSKIHVSSLRLRGKTLSHVALLPPPTTTCWTQLSTSFASSQITSFSSFRGSYRKTTKKTSFMALESTAYENEDDDDDDDDIRTSPLDVDYTMIPNDSAFRSGDKIQVEVVSFGPLGASVDVIAKGHAEEDLIDDTEPPLAKGLILQREIAYFREMRNHVDVVRGEVLPAFVEAVREDGKLDIGLRAYGGKAKAEEVSKMILDRLGETSSGMLPIGDKSSPDDIAQELPGVSKVSFKKAVSALYKQGSVQPGPDSIKLLPKDASSPPPPKDAPTSARTKSVPQQQQQEPRQTKAKAGSKPLPFGIKGGSKQGDAGRPRTSSKSSSSPRRKSSSPPAN